MLTKSDLTAIQKMFDFSKKETNEKFDRIDERFDNINKRFESIDERFDSIDERFRALIRDLKILMKDLIVWTKKLINFQIVYVKVPTILLNLLTSVLIHTKKELDELKK